MIPTLAAPFSLELETTILDLGHFHSVRTNVVLSFAVAISHLNRS